MLVTEWLEQWSGTGRNEVRDRDRRVCHPRGLRPGDVLASGETVVASPIEAGSASVVVHLGDPPSRRVTELGLPSRILLAMERVQTRGEAESYRQQQLNEEADALLAAAGWPPVTQAV